MTVMKGPDSSHLISTAPPLTPGYLIRVLLAAAALVCAGLAPACSEDEPAGTDGTPVVDTDAGDVSLDGNFNPVDGGDDVEGDGTSGGDDVAGDDTAAGDDTSGGDDAGGDDTGGSELARFDECDPTSPPACEPPLVCFRGTCQLPCNAGCPDGEVCLDVVGFGDLRICGVEVGEGGECNPDEARVCEEGLYCDEESGTCEVTGVSSSAGDECGGFDMTCGDGLVCVRAGFGGDGRCHETCENDDDCEDGWRCQSVGFQSVCVENCEETEDCSWDGYVCREPLGGGDLACLGATGDEPGSLELGEACGGDLGNCAEGLTCPSFIPGAYCTYSCSDSNPCPEDPPGLECLGFAMFGNCAFVCPGGAGDCPESDMACDDLFGTSYCHY
jgi:hypothetical protein